MQLEICEPVPQLRVLPGIRLLVACRRRLRFVTRRMEGLCMRPTAGVASTNGCVFRARRNLERLSLAGLAADGICGRIRDPLADELVDGRVRACSGTNCPGHTPRYSWPWGFSGRLPYRSPPQPVSRTDVAIRRIHDERAIRLWRNRRASHRPAACKLNLLEPRICGVGHRLRR